VPAEPRLGGHCFLAGETLCGASLGPLPQTWGRCGIRGDVHRTFIIDENVAVTAPQAALAMLPTPKGQRVKIARAQAHMEILHMHAGSSGTEIEPIGDLSDAVSLHQQVRDIALSISNREMTNRIVAPDDRVTAHHLKLLTESERKSVAMLSFEAILIQCPFRIVYAFVTRIAGVRLSCSGAFRSGLDTTSRTMSALSIARDRVGVSWSCATFPDLGECTKS
jgi:hypothetical protein